MSTSNEPTPKRDYLLRGLASLAVSHPHFANYYQTAQEAFAEADRLSPSSAPTPAAQGEKDDPLRGLRGPAEFADSSPQAACESVETGAAFSKDVAISKAVARLGMQRNNLIRIKKQYGDRATVDRDIAGLRWCQEILMNHPDSPWSKRNADPDTHSDPPATGAATQNPNEVSAQLDIPVGREWFIVPSITEGCNDACFRERSNAERHAKIYGGEVLPVSESKQAPESNPEQSSN